MDKEPENVLQWCRNLVNTIKDGGVWGIPRSGVVFKLDKQNKKLVLIQGEETDDDYLATKRVFAQIGWTVVPKEKRDDVENHS